MDSIILKSTVNQLVNGYIKDLEFVTNIDSVTGNIIGSREIAEFLKQRITELGGTYEVRDNNRGAHVIATFKGNGNKKLLLVVHTDTVLGTQDGKRLFEIDDNMIAKGAGVGDCKASAIQMLYVVKAMQNMGNTPYSEIIVFFDSEEETGSDDEYKFAEELAQKVDYAIVCDTGRPNWGVCTKRKGVARYTIDIEGVSGHAGNGIQAASNAVSEACYLATRILSLSSPMPEGNPSDYISDALEAKGIQEHGQFIPDNTINIAQVTTNNDKYNVIPDSAKLMVEIRCYETDEQKRIDSELRKICETPTINGTKIIVNGGLGQGPLQKNASAEKLFNFYKDIVKSEYNADIVEWTAGGLTIANTTSIYVPTIDALGVDVDPQCEHTLLEWVDLKHFAPRTVALIQLIDKVDSTEL